MKKFVIHCENEYESEKVLQVYEEIWFKRWGGPKPTEWKHLRQSFWKNTAYRIEKRFSIWNVQRYEKNWFTVLSYENWMKYIQENFISFQNKTQWIESIWL